VLAKLIGRPRSPWCTGRYARKWRCDLEEGQSLSL